MIRGKKIIIEGPPCSGKTTFMKKLMEENPLYSQMVIGDDVMIDLKHWKDKHTLVICTVQHSKQIPKEVKEFIDEYYVRSDQVKPLFVKKEILPKRDTNNKIEQDEVI